MTFFKKNSFLEMNKFIKNPKYIGYGFNLIERKNESLIDKIKKIKYL